MKSAFLQKNSTISSIILFVIAAVAQMSLVKIVHAQGTVIDALAPRQLADTAWQFNKYSGNPVLTAGPAGSWDANYVFSGSVMYHNSKYHMWYSGTHGLLRSIGYAYSDDGITWTKYTGNPVLIGAVDTCLGGCYVLFYSGKFHMWYNVCNSSGISIKIGYAYSDDGIHWTNNPTNVFEKGTAGSWDDNQITYGPVVKEDSVLKMFYWGKSATSSWMTGLATSSDSIHWTRQNSGNPVLSGGPMGAWDQYSQASGAMLKNDGLYKMWYDNETQAPLCIGYASSTDGGLNWSTYAGNPILRPDAGTWDAGYTIWPMVVQRPDGHYLLYYTGANSVNTIISIGLAIDSVTTTIVDHEKLYIPASFALLQNYPNPFNPTTVISYQLPVNSHVTLKIFDLLGREVATLLNERKDAGVHEITFVGSNLVSGVYFYRLSVVPSARRDLVPTNGRNGQSGTYSETKKLILLK